VRGPHRLRARIAVVVGEAVGKRGGGTMACSRVTVEPREDVARRRTAHTRQRREGNPARDREQHDPGDPQRPRRELPRSKPGGGEKENDDRERKHERRPRALDDEHALRQSRKRGEPAPVCGAEGLLVRILHRDAVIRCRRLDISVTDSILKQFRGQRICPCHPRKVDGLVPEAPTVTSTTAEVCRGRSIPRSSAAA
jgi:hypothetical protein